jgi:hypothetical protein
MEYRKALLAAGITTISPLDSEPAIAAAVKHFVDLPRLHAESEAAVTGLRRGRTASWRNCWIV